MTDGFKRITLLIAVFASACTIGKPADLTQEPRSKIDDSANAKIALVYQRIFFEGSDIPTRKFEFEHVPSAASLNIPRRPAEFSMIAIECAGFAPTGHLEDCEIGAYPGYEELGLVLAEQLRVSAETVRSIDRPIRFIDIQAKVSNSKVPLRSGPCWPPSCVGMPPPPPPPPQD